jgi:hypothetical protein
MVYPQKYKNCSTLVGQHYTINGLSINTISYIITCKILQGAGEGGEKAFAEGWALPTPKYDYNLFLKSPKIISKLSFGI